MWHTVYALLWNSRWVAYLLPAAYALPRLRLLAQFGGVLFWQTLPCLGFGLIVPRGPTQSLSYCPVFEVTGIYFANKWLRWTGAQITEGWIWPLKPYIHAFLKWWKCISYKPRQKKWASDSVIQPVPLRRQRRLFQTGWTSAGWDARLGTKPCLPSSCEDLISVRLLTQEKQTGFSLGSSFFFYMDLDILKDNEYIMEMGHQTK